MIELIFVASSRYCASSFFAKLIIFRRNRLAYKSIVPEINLEETK